MDRLIRVVPSILTEEPKVLDTMVRQAETFATYVQIDIMDGQFVPSQSITYEHLAQLRIKLDWEAHLMVLHPEVYLEGFHRAGARKVIFHYEATPSPHEVISMARNLDLEVGLAVNPETPVSAILPLSAEIDSVLFLSVHPGYYGQQFIPSILEKIAEFRRDLNSVEIGIDGGVKESNIIQIAESGTDVIYVGSAIFLQPRPSESYEHLLALAERSLQHTAE
jgi:ribulose-phosphate 3-epimerase